MNILQKKNDQNLLKSIRYTFHAIDIDKKRNYFLKKGE